MKKKSYRTTLFGAGGLVAVLASATNALLDGNPATNPDWNLVVIAVTTALALLNARDNKVSSEEAGVK